MPGRVKRVSRFNNWKKLRESLAQYPTANCVFIPGGIPCGAIRVSRKSSLRLPQRKRPSRRRMNPRNFFAELKRRNVYKVAVAYAIVGWLLVQIATQVFPIFEIPNWAGRLVVLLLILGFPVALIFSWAFEITPEGIKRESEIDPSTSITHSTGRKILAFTAVAAAIASALLVFQLIRGRTWPERQSNGST